MCSFLDNDIIQPQLFDLERSDPNSLERGGRGRGHSLSAS